jgi:hypothetical protein
MANDRNRVTLLGTLQDPQEQLSQVDGQPVYAVRALLCTDLAAYGGSHQVVFTGPCALRAMAHWQVCRDAHRELELWIEGWLRSGPEETVVVVRHTTFLVSKELQVSANKLLADRGAALNQQPEPASGRQPARARATR